MVIVGMIYVDVIREFRGDPGHQLFAEYQPYPNGWMRLLDRFRFINRILQLIVLSIERDMFLGPHPSNDIQFLPEYGNTL